MQLPEEAQSPEALLGMRRVLCRATVVLALVTYHPASTSSPEALNHPRARSHLTGQEKLFEVGTLGGQGTTGCCSRLLGPRAYGGPTLDDGKISNLIEGSGVVAKNRATAARTGQKLLSGGVCTLP